MTDKITVKLKDSGCSGVEKDLEFDEISLKMPIGRYISSKMTSSF